MKILVTGATGQLGYDVSIDAKARGHVLFDDRVDITNKQQISQYIIDIKPDAVIHCAAYTNVDKAEIDRDRCFEVNVNGTKYITDVCKDINTKLIFVSTDYVKEPQNYYGSTKLLAEGYIQNNLNEYYIVRTSWIFGTNGKNFVNTMLEIAKSHDIVKVVNDQIGRPTYSKDLAKLLVDMAETDKYGLYNACNEGPNISWYDFTKEIYRQVGLHVNVIPVTTEQYGESIAIRPKDSKLDTSILTANGFKLLPTWQNALERFLLK